MNFITISVRDYLFCQMKNNAKNYLILMDTCTPLVVLHSMNFRASFGLVHTFIYICVCI